MDDYQEKVERLLTCNICMETFTSPKTLDCEHSFCKGCLKVMFRKNKGIIVCPVCRYQQKTITTLSDIKNLSTSLYLKQTMEMFGYSREEEDNESDNDDGNFPDAAGGPVENPTKSEDSCSNVADLEKLKLSDDSMMKTIVSLSPSHEQPSSIHTDSSDGEDDIKKEVNEVSDLDTDDTDDESSRESSVYKYYRRKKKRSMFGKVMKLVLPKHSVLDDFCNVEKYDSVKRRTRSVEEKPSCSRCGQSGHMTQHCDTTKSYPKSRSSVFCSFCNKPDHDLQHCDKAIIAARHQRRKDYVKSAALLGAGYMAKTQPGASALVNTSQGRQGATTSNKKRRIRRKAKQTRRTGGGRGRGMIILI